MDSWVKDFLVRELISTQDGTLAIRMSDGELIKGNHEIIKFVMDCFTYKISVSELYEIRVQQIESNTNKKKKNR